MVILLIKWNILVIFFVVYFCDQNLKIVYLGELLLNVLLKKLRENLLNIQNTNGNEEYISDFDIINSLFIVVWVVNELNHCSLWFGL